MLPGLRPGPGWGAHDAPTNLLVGWGGAHPLSNPHPLDAFGLISAKPLRIFFLHTALDIGIDISSVKQFVLALHSEDPENVTEIR